MNRNPLVLILIAFALLFFFVSGGSVWLMRDKIPFLSGVEEASESGERDEAGKGKKKEKPVKPDIGPTFAMNPFIVNLGDPKLTKYLRVTIHLEMDLARADKKGEESESRVRDELERRLPQIRDALLTIFSSKESAMLRSVEGKEIVRQEIKEEVNKRLARGSIKNVFFSDFVIQ
ncbi:hypothetical protein CSB20_04340 [bacterium DOLZORAL124_64_63]|nr:MAG: hypothetical protein CSB20_04340 [bacterium DOLZORAL124_64_63]